MNTCFRIDMHIPAGFALKPGLVFPCLAMLNAA
jgi:hypothetical protein